MKLIQLLNLPVEQRWIEDWVEKQEQTGTMDLQGYVRVSRRYRLSQSPSMDRAANHISLLHAVVQFWWNSGNTAWKIWI
jgi:hypothetical protein